MKYTKLEASILADGGFSVPSNTDAGHDWLVMEGRHAGLWRIHGRTSRPTANDIPLRRLNIHSYKYWPVTLKSLTDCVWQRHATKGKLPRAPKMGTIAKAFNEALSRIPIEKLRYMRAHYPKFLISNTELTVLGPQRADALVMHKQNKHILLPALFLGRELRKLAANRKLAAALAPIRFRASHVPILQPEKLRHQLDRCLPHLSARNRNFYMRRPDLPWVMLLPGKFNAEDFDFGNDFGASACMSQDLRVFYTDNLLFPHLPALLDAVRRTDYKPFLWTQLTDMYRAYRQAAHNALVVGRAFGVTPVGAILEGLPNLRSARRINDMHDRWAEHLAAAARVRQERDRAFLEDYANPAIAYIDALSAGVVDEPYIWKGALPPGVRQLTTQDELDVEGIKMKHCVSSMGSILDDHVVFSLTVGEQRATLLCRMVSKSGGRDFPSIKQFYGPCNQPAPAPVQDLLVNWFRAIGFGPQLIGWLNPRGNPAPIFAAVQAFAERDQPAQNQGGFEG